MKGDFARKTFRKERHYRGVNMQQGRVQLDADWNEPVNELADDQLRDLLVQASLEWERRFAVAPRITADVAEYDASKLVGTSLRVGKGRMEGDTAVTRGVDFWKDGTAYQVKSNRPSGKPGSKVTLVEKAKNYNWDRLIWILYDREYRIQEAWEFTRGEYKKLFEHRRRLSPRTCGREQGSTPRSIPRWQSSVSFLRITLIEQSGPMILSELLKVAVDYPFSCSSQ